MKTKFLAIISSISIVLFASLSSKAEDSYLKINYGITSNNIGVTASSGAITSDDEDEGFMLSGGSMVGDFWGIDLMYYDMGDSKFTVTSDDVIKIDNANFSASTNSLSW